jgi:DNA-binding NarL/FixJ family response regulator
MSPAKKSAPAPAVPEPKPAAPSRKQILVVDDHPMMRAGLIQLIDKQPDLQVCAEAGSPAEAFARLEKTKPDMVLTDITMPGRSGIEFIKDLVALDPQLNILVISMHDETMYAERVLQAGARGYIMKESGGGNLMDAIRQVLEGRVYVSGKISAQILENISSRKPRRSDSPIPQLTNREFEVFRLIGQGRATREIAGELHLSAKTVEVHRIHIKEKLGLKDGTALVHQAIRWFENENRRGG